MMVVAIGEIGKFFSKEHVQYVSPCWKLRWYFCNLEAGEKNFSLVVEGKKFNLDTKIVDKERIKFKKINKSNFKLYVKFAKLLKTFKR